MTRLAIIADDLTGALDAAAPFAARGMTTRVALGLDGLDAALATGVDVVGVSTDSREIAPDAARQAMAACLAKLPAGLPIFKKVDSRLKGNIAAELDAIPFRRALAVPAIPAFGRWVRDGLLGGFGVAAPIDVAERLGNRSHIIVPDAVTQADIEHALASIEHNLPIGARGLAEALASQIAPDAKVNQQTPLTGPVVCIIGSTDPITLEQITRLRDARPELAYLEAPDGRVDNFTGQLAPLTVLQATRGTGTASNTAVAEKLGEALIGLRPTPGTTLVISGGATAQLVLRALGIEVLELLGEALPGLPLARSGGFTIITKSGGFGGPDALVELLAQAGTEQERQNGP